MLDQSSPRPSTDRSVRLLAVLALTAAAIRLIPLAFLHPLQWDEIEYFRATDWVRQGLVPYRDFWEHHTPLQWYLFAPFTALASGTGVGAVLVMRWAQIPLWIATFVLIAAWMRRAGIARPAAWAAIAFALASSMFMTPAIEYRIDTPGVALYVCGLYFAQRMGERRAFAALAGVAFCLAGFANLRLGPLLAATAVLLRVTDTRTRKWTDNTRANWLLSGVLVTLASVMLWFSMTRSLDLMFELVWRQNYFGDRFATAIPHGFLHRILAPSGLSLLGPDAPRFDPAIVDPGGLALLVLGAAGIVRALRRWREPGDLFLLAVLQVVGLAFIARMKFVYHYHLEIAVLMMIPLAAHALERVLRRELVFGVVIAAWCMNVYASVFRGKELDRAYQDLVMREAHARTTAADVVWDGVGWAVHRRPAYHLWFLPDLAKQLVLHGEVEPYRARHLLRRPPGVVIADQNVLTWLAVQPELRSAVVHHYLPLWRNLWIPAMSARLNAKSPGFRWAVPRDGVYRVYASEALARHPWFERPLFVGSYFGEGADRVTMRLGPPAPSNALAWRLDGAEAQIGSTVRLKKGQRLEASLTSPAAVGVMLVPGSDPVLFRQPPPNVTVDGAAPRVSHVPDFGAAGRPELRP